MSIKASKLVGFMAFVLIFTGCVVAGWEMPTDSRSNRGQALEGAWLGLRAILGIQDAEPGLVWAGRALVAAGVALLIVWMVKKFGGSGRVEGAFDPPYMPGR